MSFYLFPKIYNNALINLGDSMFRNIFIIVVVFLVGCKTIEIPKEEPPAVDNKEKKAEKEEPKITIKEYGADREVLSVKIEDKIYYTIGNRNNIDNINEQNIKNITLAAPLRISEETVKGYKGIVITYYDVKIFLGERGTGVKVGLFEPQKNAWTIGDDADRSQSIQLKLSGNSTGVITIGRSSISLSYR